MSWIIEKNEQINILLAKLNKSKRRLELTEFEIKKGQAITDSNEIQSSKGVV